MKTVLLFSNRIKLLQEKITFYNLILSNYLCVTGIPNEMKRNFFVILVSIKKKTELKLSIPIDWRLDVVDQHFTMGILIGIFNFVLCFR